MLIAIVEGLEDKLKWLDEGERAQPTVAYEGIFSWVHWDWRCEGVSN